MIQNLHFVRRIRDNFSSLEEVELFIQIFLLLTVLPLIVKLLSVPRLMNALTPGNSKQHKNLDIEKVVKFTDYILSRNLWVYKTTCLKRSLVLYRFLRKLGMNVHICFGVRSPDGESRKKLEGHAWLLYNGDIFLERNIEMTKTYKVTYCFPERNEQKAQEAILKQS
jgi:Transglutaminase-like superfamily